MEIEEVKRYLCHNDVRNPIGVISYLTKEQIEDEQFSTKSKDDCYCDNCYYGRTKLAECILEQLKL